MLKGAFTVNVDHLQAGVGGVDTWTQRARPADKYRLRDKHYSYSFYIRPVKNRADAVATGRCLCK